MDPLLPLLKYKWWIALPMNSLCRNLKTSVEVSFLWLTISRIYSNGIKHHPRYQPLFIVLRKQIRWCAQCLIYSVQAPSSPSSPTTNEPKYERRWLDTLSVPLLMARISRYKAGTDKLRFVIQQGGGCKSLQHHYCLWSRC